MIKLPPLWFVLLLCAAAWLCLTPPVQGVELSEPIPGAVSAFDFGDWSGDASTSFSPDHDPNAPPREYEAAESGQDSSGAATTKKGEESTTDKLEAAESGQDSSGAATTKKGEESTTDKEEAAGGGQDSSEAAITIEGEAAAALVDQVTGIADDVRFIRETYEQGTTEVEVDGQSNDEPLSDDSNVTVSDSSSSDSSTSISGDNSSQSAGYDSSGDDSTEDIPPATLDDIHTDLWLLLFSLWGMFGMFLAFKVGGVILGRL